MQLSTNSAIIIYCLAFVAGIIGLHNHIFLLFCFLVLFVISIGLTIAGQ